MPRLPDDPEQVRMSFGAHLDELRKRLVRAIIVNLVLFLACFLAVPRYLQEAFLHPYHMAVDRALERKPELGASGLGDKLALMSPIENVMWVMKIALIAALTLGLPYLMWEMWQFVGAGLYPKERRTVTRYMPFSVLLAGLGVLFGYFYLIPLVLEYLFLMVDPGLFVQSYRLDYYFSFFLMLTFAQALVFQLPLILLGLHAVGLVQAATLRKYRKHFILGAFILCAVLTPPDPFSQTAMAVPTILLYELGIFLITLRDRRAKSKATAAQPAEAGQ
ncbi:MAG: twin-arginine translocase subunit TatC [Planctomycetota bacterium]|nr:MAG: twin-arginine translocase subunit TatC [Planctomycetota bacterium]